MRRGPHEVLRPFVGIPSGSYQNAAVQGDGVDFAGFEDVLAIIDLESTGPTTFVSIEMSPNGNSWQGAGEAVRTMVPGDEGINLIAVRRRSSDRYLRATLVTVGTGQLSVTLVGCNVESWPVTQQHLPLAIGYPDN